MIVSGQSQTNIGIEHLKSSGKQMMQNLSPEMIKQLGVYIQILQKRQRLQQTSLLKGTILADKIRPKELFVITVKILLFLIVLIYFLNIFLPKPLKVQIINIEHNPQTGQQCTQKTCQEYIDFIQEMEIRHLSPLNRKLQVYLELDQVELKRYEGLYQKVENQSLVEQIDKVEIFKLLKEGQEIGERINLIEGDEIIEEIVDGKPMYYAGDIHVIDSPNFLVRVVKKTKKPYLPLLANQTIKKYLQDQNVQQAQTSNKTENSNLQTEGSQQSEKSQNKVPKTESEQQVTVSQQPSNKNTNTTQKSSQSKIDVTPEPKNQTDVSSQNNTQPSQQNKTEPLPTPPTVPQQKQSFPLIITAFYHSYPYTFLELLFRFIFLVLDAYVISQTPHTPRLLHYIMIAYCNPFIFLEVASPTFVFSIISSICESSYICFLLIFIYYTHTKSQNPMVHHFTLGSKLLLVLFIFVVNVLRLQHTFEDFQVYSLETTLIVAVFVILGTYVWDMIVYYKQQLYRDILTVTITLWYMLIGFVSNYAIMLGWEELIKFVIVQIFAINICYLVDKYEVNPKWEVMMNLKNQFNNLGAKEKSSSLEQLENPIESSIEVTGVREKIKDKILRKTLRSKKEKDNSKIQPNSSKQMKNADLHHQNQIEEKKSPKTHSFQKQDAIKQNKIYYVNVRTNEVVYT